MIQTWTSLLDLRGALFMRFGRQPMRRRGKRVRLARVLVTRGMLTIFVVLGGGPVTFRGCLVAFGRLRVTVSRHRSYPLGSMPGYQDAHTPWTLQSPCISSLSTIEPRHATMDAFNRATNALPERPFGNVGVHGDAGQRRLKYQPGAVIHQPGHALAAAAESMACLMLAGTTLIAYNTPAAR
ncbi:hypothetical protein [Brevundimonas mediterranea]|uniref:Uncharacterized protein n=1 Tax=Brevundimonas mediterranea TaxID=74329 RepID=A0A7W6A797_9CAUL|nr:hypothetical protein [Brevundimonas mediterranea]MBB3873065.1 hypothetical protein [Brevundimonas mediterranea]